MDKILVMADTESFTSNLFQKTAQLSKGMETLFEVVLFK